MAAWALLDGTVHTGSAPRASVIRPRMEKLPGQFAIIPEVIVYSRKDNRISRSGLSTLRSTSATLCQVPSATRPASTGSVTDGATKAGMTWLRPWPRDPCACRQRSSAGSSSRSAASRSGSLPEPSSMIARPAVACGTNTFSSPSPPSAALAANRWHRAVMSATVSRLPVRNRISSVFTMPRPRACSRLLDGRLVVSRLAESWELDFYGTRPDEHRHPRHERPPHPGVQPALHQPPVFQLVCLVPGTVPQDLRAVHDHRRADVAFPGLAVADGDLAIGPLHLAEGEPRLGVGVQRRGQDAAVPGQVEVVVVEVGDVVAAGQLDGAGARVVAPVLAPGVPGQLVIAQPLAPWLRPRAAVMVAVPQLGHDLGQLAVGTVGDDDVLDVRVVLHPHRGDTAVEQQLVPFPGRGDHRDHRMRAFTLAAFPGAAAGAVRTTSGHSGNLQGLTVMHTGSQSSTHPCMQPSLGEPAPGHT